jgi:hypothetical protein
MGLFTDVHCNSKQWISHTIQATIGLNRSHTSEKKNKKKIGYKWSL